MKGTGIGLLLAYMIIAIILAASILSLASTSYSVTDYDCSQKMTNDVLFLITKMNLLSSARENFDLDVRNCVEYIENDGIKFKEEDSKRLFAVTDCDPYVRNPNLPLFCDDSERLKFEFAEEKILPSSVPQKVKTRPPNTIEFIGR